MPSNPPKVRPLSDYGGPSRALHDVGLPGEAAIAAAKHAGPEGRVAAKVADVAVTHKNRPPNRTLKQEAGKRAKKSIVRSVGKSTGSGLGSRSVLLAEFVVCFLILALSPLSKDVKANEWMKKASAVSLLFMILALVGSAGGKSARAVGAFGALVTVALLVDQRGVFGIMVSKFGNKQTQDAIAAGQKSFNAGGTPQIIRTPQGPQTITVVPGPNGSWVAGNSADF